MTLVFAGHRCADHSPSSGYDQVCALFPDAGWLHGPDLVAGRLVWVRPPAASTTVPSVVHVFYGDTSGSALPRLVRARFGRTRVVATVHRPIDRLVDDPAARAMLDTVDAIVVVSRRQAEALSRLGPRASVHVVPHGVWVDAFRPVPARGVVPRNTVLTVGSYLRDWDGMGRILTRLATLGVPCVVVGAAASQRVTVEHPLVRFVPRLSEAALAAEYDRATALLLPVLDGTASNALLEAMAAGCPVISPRGTPLVDEYLGDEFDAYDPDRTDTAVDRALAYVGDAERRAARSSVLMRRADRFDWLRLRRPLEEVYRFVAARAPAGPQPHRPPAGG